MNQSELEANSSKWRQARENAGERIMLDFADWSRKWHDLTDQSQSVVKQNQNRHGLGPCKRVQNFHSTAFNIVKFNLFWQTISVHRHPASFTIIQHHSTWWPNECNMLNSIMLNVIEWKIYIVSRCLGRLTFDLQLKTALFDRDFSYSSNPFYARTAYLMCP